MHLEHYSHEFSVTESNVYYRERIQFYERTVNTVSAHYQAITCGLLAGQDTSLNSRAAGPTSAGDNTLLSVSTRSVPTLLPDSNLTAPDSDFPRRYSVPCRTSEPSAPYLVNITPVPLPISSSIELMKCPPPGFVMSWSPVHSSNLFSTARYKHGSPWVFDRG